jgi:hypothetical protein
MKGDLLYELVDKPLLYIAAIIVVSLLIGFSVGHCAIPPGTPGNTLCQADLDGPTCAKFQAVLKQHGHDLQVLEGTAFGTVADLKHKTFVVILKCVDRGGFIHIVGIKFEKDKLKSIMVNPTEERNLGA